MRVLLLILGSIIVAILLSLVPLPPWLGWAWPKWVVLVSIYWALALPNRYGIGMAWLLGLLLDLIQGTALGEQAFALAVVTYIVLKFREPIRLLIDAWRLVVVFLLVFCYQTILFVLQALLQKMPFLWQFWLTAFTSAFAWLLIVYPLLRAFQQHFRVHEPTVRRYI